MKKTFVILLALCILFSTCGAALADVAATDNLTPLDYEAVSDFFYKYIEDVEIPTSAVFDVHQGTMEEDGSMELSFILCNEPCSIIMNGFTGEVIENRIPEELLQNAAIIRDFSQDDATAIQAVFQYKGTPEQARASVTYLEDGGVDIKSHFDAGGKHYDTHVEFLPGYYYYKDGIPKTKSPKIETPKDYAGMPELDSSYLIDVASRNLAKLSDNKLDATNMDSLTVSTMDADGNKKVSFKLGNYDCFFLINAFTGKVVDKEVSQEAINSTRDYLGEAIQIVFDTYNCHGSANNIMVEQKKKKDKLIINVQFDFNGEHISEDVEFDLEPEKEKEESAEEKMSKKEMQDEAIAAALARVEGYDGSDVKAKVNVKKSNKIDVVTVKFKYNDTAYEMTYIPCFKAFVSKLEESDD